MNESPNGRPKRTTSSIASFYIDDDFEDESNVGTNVSKKGLKEEIFVVSEEKIDPLTAINSASKKVAKSKTKAKTQKKQESSPASKSRKPIKTVPKIFESMNSSAEEDFELVMDQSEDEYKKHRIDENFDNQKSTLAFSNTIVKRASREIPSKPLVNSFKPKPSSTIEKVRIPESSFGARRVGLSRSTSSRPLSPVKIKRVY